METKLFLCHVEAVFFADGLLFAPNRARLWAAINCWAACWTSACLRVSRMELAGQTQTVQGSGVSLQMPRTPTGNPTKRIVKNEMFEGEKPNK